MQYLDHDMDDLFHKAGENYPLRTDEDDWDKMSAKLAFKPPADPVVLGKKDYKDYRILLIGLLLLLFMILGGIFHFYKPERKQTVTSEHLYAVDTLKSGAFKKQDHAGILPMQSAIKNSLQESVGSDREKSLVHKKNMDILKQGYAKSIKQRIYRHQDNFTNNNLSGFFKLPESSGQNVPAGRHILKNTMIKSTALLLQYSITEPALLLTPVKISAKSRQNKNGLYIGLAGGPEWSMIGSQASTGSGFRWGITAGYRLNNKWSIESGITLGKNNYYSKGSYFNMSKIASYMPSGMEILTVDGQNTNLEIPVTLKYYFLQRQHTELFFTGGILSNIYLREKNYYQTMLNGVKDNQMGLYPANHFFVASQLRLGIGYEHNLSRLNSFRIEPYKNIPLRKTGMGSMPVFSSGVNIGIIHVLER